MKAIYKYEIKDTVCLPEGFQILDCQLQNGVPVFWALVETNKDWPKENIKFRVAPTGAGDLNDYLNGWIHFKTIQDNAGFVWHHFMKEEE